MTVVRAALRPRATPQAAALLLVAAAAWGFVVVRALDIREDLSGLLVHGGKITGGMADLPYELEIR